MYYHVPVSCEAFVIFKVCCSAPPFKSHIRKVSLPSRAVQRSLWEKAMNM
jgi:hypothetical protein